MFLSIFGKLLVIFTLILYNFHTISATEPDTCIRTDNKTCKPGKTNKYSQAENIEYSKYIKEIERAKAQYVPCNSTNCNCYSAVINDNLRAFKEKGITKSDIDAVKSKGTKYQIIQHKLYRDPHCMFPSRCAGIEHFLLDNVGSLPDMEFIINTRDWPQVHKNYGQFGPVLSFSKTHEYHDIMYPAWAFWEGGPAISLYPRGIGRWDTHRAKLGKVGNSTKWTDKLSVAFFRGSRTSSERDPLVLLSRDSPDLVDAKYTKNQAWKSEADTLHAPPAKEVSFEHHCNYKYLFNFRGVAASFRLKHILLCKSLIFHVGNEWQEFFYPALKPWIHYVPVNSHASKEELRRLIEFARDHDELMREIAEEGYKFVWRNLRMKDVGCYWRKLLKKYGGLLRFEVERDGGLVEVV